MVEQSIAARRVLYSCGKVAAAILATEPSRKRGGCGVARILHMNVGEAMKMPAPRFMTETERQAAFVAVTHAAIVALEADRRAAKKGVTIDTEGHRCIAQTHGRVCGGTSVKTSNREVRDCYDSCISKRHARRARTFGWKFEQRRAEKAWRWKKWQRDGRKIELQNQEYLLTH